MQIVNRDQFLRLPENTLYAKIALGDFNFYDLDQIFIKGETVGDVDFYCQDIVDAFSSDSREQLNKALSGEDVALDLDWQTRDGFFDEEQMFAVWSQEDVKQLIMRLTRCVDQESTPLPQIFAESLAREGPGAVMVDAIKNMIGSEFARQQRSGGHLSG